MITRVKQVCAKAGVAADDAEHLMRLLVDSPQGTIDMTDLSGANDVQLALLAAIVAATNTRQFGQVLQFLLAFVEAEQTALSDYDSGCFWHLKGVAAWRLGRLDEALYPALRAFNRSVIMLERSNTPDAQAYLARVFDTCGQVVQHQGLLREARLEFERALRLREAAQDTAGAALTLGNLGRLCMELGDFTAAAVYLARDLAIVERLSPGQTRVQAQLLSHLGTCAVEQGDAARAQGYFTRSTTLAQAADDVYDLTFAALGMGRVALLVADLAQAEVQAQASWAASSVLPLHAQEGIRGLIHQLKAETHLARSAVPQAVAAFEAAYACFLRTSHVSVVERAQLLYGYARARLANGEEQQAAHLLREALQHLDASTAEPLRQEIEGMLRTNFRESWLLHVTSRFIGQQYMDFLLAHAGGSEFRGTRQDVVILFCDLRGFTTLTEQSTAEPEAFVTILNDYLRHMTRCIDRAGGIVCQFNGDGVMAVFSLPVPRPADDAERAVLAALLMQEELQRFCRTLSAGSPCLIAGVGLHAGPVIAGLFGSPQKRLYTVNGDAANTASRMEGLTKYLGASILISASVSQRFPTPERFLLRPLGRYRLKGRDAAVDVADVMGENDGSHFARLITEEIAQVQHALACFQQRQFAEADAAFTALALATSQAGNEYRAQGYQFLAATANAYQDTPPAAAWDGTIDMEVK